VSDAGDAGPRIFVRGLRVVGVHGALPEERQRAQPFELDLDVWGDVGAAADSDRLSDTADYGVLATRAAEVVATTSFALLEALARAVAAALLEADARVEAVAVTVRKLRPPLALDVDSVGVRLLLRRD
jgi:7,8-dihydroneopterin aldolase/epimerase/oxygenase